MQECNKKSKADPHRIVSALFSLFVILYCSQSKTPNHMGFDRKMQSANGFAVSSRTITLIRLDSYIGVSKFSSSKLV